MASSRPLADAPDRSYARKLGLFADFAASELREVLAGLGLGGDARGPNVACPRRVLDVGCGIGATAGLMAELLGRDALVVGIDLSLPHLRVASEITNAAFVQADAASTCFREATVDLIWTCNTINHLRDPVGVLRSLRALLASGGRMVLAQGGLLPEMYFAWDAPLDDAVRRACHAYYRDRYGLTSQDTAGIRGLVRLANEAEFTVRRVRTIAIERIQPLTTADRRYFEEAIFAGTWGERIHGYLSADERDRLARFCTPGSPEYCLDRADFHHIQTLTLCECRA
jgi:SAM-dependent methyltransferase